MSARLAWSGFGVDAGLEVKKDLTSLAAFTAAIRAQVETPNVHVDIFDRHRVILEGEECELVQVAVYREGRPEDMLGFDANSTLSRRIVKPVFEAALTYWAATGVIQVVAKTRNGWQSIETPGFGKGYVIIRDGTTIVGPFLNRTGSGCWIRYSPVRTSRWGCCKRCWPGAGSR